MQEIMTVSEAAKYLRIDTDTLRAYERDGWIVSVRYPSLVKEGKRRTCLFTRAALDAFILSCQPEIAGPIAGPIDDRQRPEMPGNVALRQQGQKSRKKGNVHWREGHAAKA